MKRKPGKLLSKMLVSIVLPMVALVLILELSAIVFLSYFQITDAHTLNMEMANAIGQNFEEINASIRSYFNLITMDETLQRYMARTGLEPLSDLENNVEIRSIVSDKVLLNDNVEAVYVFRADGRLRTFWHRKSELGTAPLYRELPTQWCPESGKVASRMDGGQLLYMRRVRSLSDLDTLGFVALVYDTEAFAVQFNNLMRGKKAMIYVEDGQGRVVISNSAASAETERIAQAARTHTENGLTRIDGLGVVSISRHTGEPEGWKTVSILEIQTILASSGVMVGGMLLQGVIVLVVGAYVCMALLRRNIIGPIDTMIEGMNKVDEGDYSVRIELSTMDELEGLANSMNTMLERTDTLINQVLRDRILHKELQIAMLQAQINPHLLHNTLECINWLAEFGRKEDIRTVTLSLSRLMQSLADGVRFVSIDKELEYTSCFLRIYEILLGGRLTYSIARNVSGDYEIPKLTIQPLVENAVIHGIKRSLDGGHIDITVSEAEKGILISVMDDGVGMEPHVVDAVNDMGKTGHAEGLGVGLRNVIERIRVLYGDAAEIRCTSGPSWGTMIDLLLPYHLKEEEEHENHPDRG